MARSRNTADTQTASGGPVSPSIAGKNAVINGGMDIWQRGTSALDGQNTYKTADRWLLSSATAVTFSRQTTGDTTNLPFIQYCMRVQRTSGSTSTSGGNISQSFETVNSIPLAGKTVTLSFYARKGADYSASSSVLRAEMYTGTGTDQNVYTVGYTGSVTAIYQNATLTTTWQRFSFTATLAANITEIGTTFVGSFTGTASTNDYYEITGIQLEVGSVATSFARNAGTIQGELAACQRYYFRTTLAADAVTPFTSAAYSTTAAYGIMNSKVTMRTIPSSVDYSNIRLTDAVNSYTITNLALWSVRTEDALGLLATGASGLTQYRPYILCATTSSGFIGLSAEL